jgi:DNA-binding SARP family transcriptional activator
VSGARRVLRGLAALAGLLVVLVGVPVTLASLGQGPPGGLPSWHAMSRGLAHSVTDTTLLRAAALLCWLVWALFALAVLLEIADQVVGLPRRFPSRTRRWRIGIPGLQGWARTLVLGAALLLPQRAMVGAVADPSPVTAQASITGSSAVVTGPPVVLAPAPAGASTTAHVPSPVQHEPSAPRRYVVKRYDSLWAIAEHHLGSGIRWREIRDGGGRHLGGNGVAARTIYPGEVLLLPPATTPRPSGRPVSPAPTKPPIPRGAAPGTPRSVAPATAPTSAPAASKIPPTGAVAPASVAPPAPAASARPPTRAVAPASVAPPAPAASLAPPVPGASTAPTGGVAPADLTAPASPTPPTMVAMTADRRSPSGPADATALFEGGMVGAAILGMIGVLRRQQARHRPPGRRIRLPGPAVSRTELSLRQNETPDRMLLVERAAASLVTTLPDGGVTPPAILGILVDDNTVEVLLAHPAPPPPAWVAVAEGFRWRIAASDLPPDLPNGSAPLPALASLGRVASGTADALINLEAAGLVGVAGDPAQAAGLLYAMASQLLGAPWARAATIVLVGFPPGLAGSDNARTVPSISALAEELKATAEVMSATARQHGCPDVFAGRLRGVAGDGWPPIIVLSAQRPTGRELELLASVAQPGQGVAAVVVGAGRLARWEIDAGAHPCPVNPLRLAIEPTVLDTATMQAIAELLEVAEDKTGASLEDPPYDRIEVSVERPDGSAANQRTMPAATTLTQRLTRLHAPNGAPNGSPNGPSNGAPNSASSGPAVPDLGHPPVLVRVLGSVEIDGASDFKRAKSRELVVYLAMHPNGVGESELDEALWGEAAARVVISSTRDSTVSVARSALGGAARLLPAQGQGREKRYQLGPDVQSDWVQFCTLHRFGRDHQSVAALHQALELVRGRPFEAVISGRTYGWIHTEGHARHIEAEVADAADLAAGFYLDAGDPLSARWAARRGLLAEPYTERLWVRLMEAADAIGESQEIERIMDEMDVVLELEGDFTGLHPNTLAAYDRLSRRHRFPVDT